MSLYRLSNFFGLHVRRLMIPIMTLLLLLLYSTLSASAAPIISKIVTSNVRDVQFTVSWKTDVAASGTVNYGTTTALGSTANDERGASTNSTTHHVNIAGLNPNTLYYFDVVSGSTTDNNGGGHYSVTTGPTLGLPASDTVYGQVFKSDGTTLAVGTIVYLYIADNNGAGSTGRSQVASALVDGTGYWFYNLGNVRTATNNAYFVYSASGGDNLALSAQGGADGGRGTQNVDTGSDKPAPNIIITSPPTAVTLSSFAAQSNDNTWLPTIMWVLMGGGLMVLLSGWVIKRKHKRVRSAANS